MRYTFVHHQSTCPVLYKKSIDRQMGHFLYETVSTVAATCYVKTLLFKPPQEVGKNFYILSRTEI